VVDVEVDVVPLVEVVVVLGVVTEEAAEALVAVEVLGDVAVPVAAVEVLLVEAVEAVVVVPAALLVERR
jgi:hypothetical protein